MELRHFRYLVAVTDVRRLTVAAEQVLNIQATVACPDALRGGRLHEEATKDCEPQSNALRPDKSRCRTLRTLRSALSGLDVDRGLRKTGQLRRATPKIHTRISEMPASRAQASSILYFCG